MEKKSAMYKNENGENVHENVFGVKTYLPTKEELEEIGFDVDELFSNEIKVSSATGQLSFRITNSGTDWKVFLTVKNGMFTNAETCWVIHPQSMKDVKAIIYSFTAQFANRNVGIF